MQFKLEQSNWAKKDSQEIRWISGVSTRRPTRNGRIAGSLSNLRGEMEAGTASCCAAQVRMTSWSHVGNIREHLWLRGAGPLPHTPLGIGGGACLFPFSKGTLEER